MAVQAPADEEDSSEEEKAQGLKSLMSPLWKLKRASGDILHDLDLNDLCSNCRYIYWAYIVYYIRYGA